MKYKILVDSSSDLLSNYIVDENVGFAVVPLTINVNGHSYVDDDNVDTLSLLKDCDASSIAGKSACPSPNDFGKYYEDAEIIIVVTISSKLSGSYNSALVAIQNSNNKKVIVIDSLAVAGTMDLIVDKAFALCKEDALSFEELSSELTKYRDSLHLYFVLDKFDNLMKNGRMNKIVARIASILLIKPLSYACDGQIKILEKIRTSKGAYKRLVNHIGKEVGTGEGKVCIITVVNNEFIAKRLKEAIEELYKFDEVRIIPPKGLTSFYALQNGVLVAF